VSDSKKKHLLVVDDEKEICNFVKLFFETRGFTVHQAYDGEEAVQIAEKIQPHIVLLDINMKLAEDGLLALPRIRTVSPKSKVLMTTGVSDEISIVRAKSLGATDYLTKPLILEELEAKVIRESRDA
jgi:two-component system OmpR family response regulator